MCIDAYRTNLPKDVCLVRVMTVWPTQYYGLCERLFINMSLLFETLKENVLRFIRITCVTSIAMEHDEPQPLVP